MKKNISLVLITLLVAGISYLLFEIIRGRIIYESTKLEEININTESYKIIINKFDSKPIKINYTYQINENDTIITFDTENQTGLLWIISGTKDLNLKNSKAYKKNNILELEDGTYRTFYSGTKPLVSINYRNGKDIKEENLCDFYVLPRSSINFQDSFNGFENVWQFLADGVIELINSNDKLIYRIELGSLTEMFIFKVHNSTYFLFIQ